MAGYVSVSTTVDVDLDDVLDEISTDDLRAELKRRNLEAPQVFEGRFEEEIRAAADAGRAWDLLRLVQEAFSAETAYSRGERYAKLERDPVSGRPVIQ